MKKRRVLYTILLIFTFFDLQKVNSQSSSNDASVMASLKKSLELPKTLFWNDLDPCKWDQVACNVDQRITRIQIGRQGVKGKLPLNLGNLTELQRLELQFNEISGPLPSLSGLSQLQALLLGSNGFTSIPHDMFEGMSSLQVVFLDDNPFSTWSIPASLEGAVSLQNFSANSANVGGTLPGFLSGVANLHLSFNSISGGLPATFAGSSIQTLWINGQKLNGSVEVLKSMTNLQEGWLHSNEFTGAIPDLSELVNLQSLSLRDNQLTGIVPPSLLSLPSLRIVNLTNNELQGPFPKFGKSISADVAGANSFCSEIEGGSCDPLVEILLAVAGDVGYPLVFAQNWKGDSPCSPWLGITCVSGNITVINFQKMGLTGSISGNFSKLTSLQRIVLSNNNLTGTIPTELTTLTHLKELDLSNNNLHGRIPSFPNNVVVKTDGNRDIGKEFSTAGPNESPGKSSSASSPATASSEQNSPGNGKSTGVIAGTVAGVCMAAFIGFIGFFLYYKKRKPLGKVQSPSMNSEKSLISGIGEETAKGMYMSSYRSTTMGSESHFSGESHMMEPGRMVIPVSVLRNVTGNFSEKNILGRGGFGTVYKGELHDGTKVAVKRMEAGAVSEKGLNEFKSEIDVLTKVRHRHLVGLLGHCLEGNERLLVYEYMPKGTLSSHLFYWKEDGLMPLDWSKRLVISLDVARGVEYLHGLAHQSFIHRDLKPSNILLGDDMRAKVADFGLVRLAPDGKSSFETRLAGTFGYLAPEYAVTGRVTTKVDVFSFGVILMEVITGRKALDESQPEDSMHLVTWFRRMHVNKEMFRKAIDPTIDTDEGILASISTVSELAWHCCAREPYQRPDMGHVVNVLSSLVDRWNPSDHPSEDSYAIDFDLTLPQALKKWQSVDPDPDSSSSFSLDNTYTSIPICPTGFADTFNSDDAR